MLFKGSMTHIVHIGEERFTDIRSETKTTPKGKFKRALCRQVAARPLSSIRLISIMSPHAVAPSSRNCLSLLSLLDRFAVTHNAFLPSELPLDRLPDPSYEPWERIGERLPFLIQQRRLQSVIDQMEIISIDALVTEGEWRRAYVLLAFLAQGYIWGGDVPEKVSALDQYAIPGHQLTTPDPATIHLHPLPSSLSQTRTAPRPYLRRQQSLELHKHLPRLLRPGPNNERHQLHRYQRRIMVLLRLRSHGSQSRLRHPIHDSRPGSRNQP